MTKPYIKPEKLTKLIPSISYVQTLSEKNREKAAIKFKNHEDLFRAGQMWQIKGNKLGDARQSFKIKDREMTDDEYKIFSQGFVYMARTNAYILGKQEVAMETLPIECTNNKEFMDFYIEGRGFTCGFNGLAVHELPTQFVGKKAFLVGYRKGIQEKSRVTENNKRR